MKRKAVTSILDDVKASLPARKGFAPWHETLPAGVLAEITAIKESWRSGELPATKTALGTSLSKALTERGFKIGHLGVIRWLEKP